MTDIQSIEPTSEPTSTESASAQQSQSQSQSFLSQYVQVRWQLACVQAKLKEIEPFAVLEALDIVSAEDARNQVVYRSDNSDVVVQFRKTRPKDDEHHELQSLRELIEIEQEKAKRTNAQAVAEVEKAIELLNQKLVTLSQTDEGRQLQEEYDALVIQLTEYKPILAVKLK